MMQFGVKERLDEDKSLTEESQDIGWNTKATQKHQKEDSGWIIFGEYRL